MKALHLGHHRTLTHDQGRRRRQWRRRDHGERVDRMGRRFANGLPLDALAVVRLPVAIDRPAKRPRRGWRRNTSYGTARDAKGGVA